MSSTNPFDVLGDDDNDDPSLLIAAHQQKKAASKKIVPAAPQKDPPKFPTKPASPAQAVREAAKSGGGGGGSVRGRGGQGRGRGGGYVGGNRDRDYDGNENVSGGYGYGVEEGEIRKPFERDHGGPRRPYRGGGRRGGLANGEVGGDAEHERPRRMYDRRSGTGRGNELKREGSGRGNWGTMSDDVIAIADAQPGEEKAIVSEKESEQQGVEPEVNVENKESEAKEKEGEEEKPEDKEMTLEEYEKIREEKRKALLAAKGEERKVDLDREFESMKLLSVKKGNGDIFIKLGPPSKEARKTKAIADYGDKVKKPISINEFLKPAEGGRSGGRGRGRGGRGGRGGSPYVTGEGHLHDTSEANIRIEDRGQFPTLCGN